MSYIKAWTVSCPASQDTMAPALFFLTSGFASEEREI